MLELNVPGVYVEEVPSGARAIVGVATSVTAFVGRTRRGRVDAPIRCSSFGDFERRCGGLWSESELGHAVQQFFANGGGVALISRAHSDPDAGTALSPSTGNPLRLKAADPGAWGNAIRYSIIAGPSYAPPSDPMRFHLEVNLLDAGGEAIVKEELFDVSVDPASDRFVTQVLSQGSSLVRAHTVPSAPPPHVTDQPLEGGSDGAAPTDTQLEDAIERLELADVVNLLVVPPPSRTSDTSAAVLATAQAFCARRRAILLVDPPQSWGSYEDAAALAGLAGLRSANTAIYYPRILAADPLQDNRRRPFAPSGAMAGLIARTDAERGVWKAPAGQEATLAGVHSLDVAVDDDQSGVLNGRGVNALRQLPPAGVVAWGARTGRGADTLASEWKYLPVRRLALFIEESLARGTQWAVFEPNDEPLWAELRLSAGAFMNRLFRQGAFAGEKASDAYHVRCDASTTTPDDVARGVVNVMIGFAPLRPAEFVVLHFQQIAGQ